MSNMFEVNDVILSSGQTMKVTVFGTGEDAFVIIPGMSLTPTWTSAGALVKRFNDYLDRYTFYLVDRKENFEDDYSIDMMAADTKEALNLLGVQSAYVYGASQGGMITMQLAISYPEFTKAIVVASSTSKTYEHTIPVWLRWKELCDAEDIVGIAEDTFQNIYSEEFQEKYGRAYARLAKSFPKELCKTFGILNEANKELQIYYHLKEIKCPALVIGAGKDKIFGDIPSRDIAKEIGCECYIYEYGSHAIYDEEPDFIDRIIDFFESVKYD